jgi:predicted nucleotidyltransferase
MDPGGYAMPVISTEEMVERLADLDRVAPDIELIVLFGSRASGRARPHSDLDIAVRGGGPVDLETLYLALAPRLGTDRLDLVDLRTAGSVLAFEVARHGQPLFERGPGTFRRFQALASRRYADTAKLRRAQRRAIHAFLERQGLG